MVAAISSNIAAMGVRKIIGSSTMKSAKKGRLRCMINNYLHSPIAAISENARFVVCRFH
jgi:hypothetical protein